MDVCEAWISKGSKDESGPQRSLKLEETSTDQSPGF